MKKIILLSLFIVGIAISTVQGRPKFDRGIEVKTFIPKGQWFAGGTMSYMQHSINDFNLLVVLNNVKAEAYVASGRAFLGYTFSNDVAAGLSFSYGRTMTDLENLELSLSDDMTFGVKDFSLLEHNYTGVAFLRTYINLGKSKRFGLYNDFRFMFGGGQGKILNGRGESLKGTYTKMQTVGVVLSPGVTVFVNNFMAVEASVGIMGIEYKRVEQITNQVYQGYRESFSANFKIDLFSIGLGVAFYF